MPISRIRWPPGFKRPTDSSIKPRNHVETAWAAVEGRSGLVIAYSRLEMLDRLAGYIRGVGDDRVERAFARKRLELVAQSKIDPVGNAKLSGIPPGDRQCLFGDIDGHEASPGLAVRRGDRQTARACPHIDGTRRCEVAG